MPVTPTYPGLYLEELPSNARTVTPAPTSVTVFVGYTHPFKTKSWDTAVQLFSFTEYEREFGGLYASGIVDQSVAYAVHQFFLNGGGTAWVVGLQPQYWDAGGTTLGNVEAPEVTIGGATGLLFRGREPTDLPNRSMLITIDNVSGLTGDITITYGTQLETYRGVSLDQASPRFIENVIGTPADPISGLVTVEPAGAAYPAAMPTANATPVVAETLPVGFVTTMSASDFTGVFQADSSLDKVRIFNLLCVPGIADQAVTSAALVFAEKKLAFCILDPPRNADADGTTGLTPIDTLVPALPKSTNGALYFPYLTTLDPLTGSPKELAPSGFVAGKYAANDNKRGVWKSPAGLETTISTTTGVVARGAMTNERQGVLNPIGVNVLRTFPDAGTVIFGARTLVTANTALQQWRYIAVRRMALFIEQTLMNNLGWAVFEPNDQPLWDALRTSVTEFMLSMFRQAAFQGSTPSQAFKVLCDATTTTQTDIDNGIVNILVAFRPLKPAEFVVIKIAQLAGQTP